MLFAFSLARGHFSQGRRPGRENRPLVSDVTHSRDSPQTSRDFAYGVMCSGWSMIHFTQRGARPHMLAHL